MTKINSAHAIAKLKVIFARFGLPLTITADNGRQFISQDFKQYCVTNNITLNSTIPYWPQQNGEVERQNRSLMKRLAISQEAKRDWVNDLHDYLIMYRSTPHSTTMKTPSELMYGWNIRDKLPSIQQPKEIDEELHDRDKEKKERGKLYADKKRRARTSDIMIGDNVLLKRQMSTNKLSTTFEPTTFRVIEKHGPEVLVENTETKTQYRRNVAHVKKIQTDSAESSESEAAINEDISDPHDEANNIPPIQAPAENPSQAPAIDPGFRAPATKRSSEQLEETATKRTRTRPTRFNDYKLT